MQLVNHLLWVLTSERRLVPVCKDLHWGQIIDALLNVTFSSAAQTNRVLLWRPPQALRSRAAWGQEQFQLLLQSKASSQTAASQEDQDLEDLRYRWMLHKSKLKDVTLVRKRTRAKVREDDGVQVDLKCLLLLFKSEPKNSTGSKGTGSLT